MAGRRLLDAAKLYQAVKTVAKQHIALRSQQYDVYSNTSTLAKAAKEQTDRVTLTVRAGIVLAKRLAEDAPKPQQWQIEEQESVQNYTDGRSQTAKEDLEQKANKIDTRCDASSTFAATTGRASSSSATSDSQAGNDEGPVTATKDVLIQSKDEKTIDRSDESPIKLNIEASRAEQASDLLRGDHDIHRSKPEITSDAIEGKAQSSSVEEPKPVATLPESTTVAEIQQNSIAPDPTQSDVGEQEAYQLRESRVPSTRLGRLWQYGGLGMSMAFGAMGESLRRATGGSGDGSVFLSPGNLELLVAKLSRMRGAALKLGQMVSFQDIKMLPPEIHSVLQRVQDSADYMPPSQRDKVLSANLGSDWRDMFEDFEERPIAAASIGQVHRATYRPTGQKVAVKVQYPGVAKSIDSDLNNLSILLTASKLLPRGLFLNKTIDNARTELAWECDYIREAECATRFRSLLADDTKTYTVPEVINDASGKTVLTAEYMSGKAVTKLPDLPQSERDWIGTNILRLCLREICDFKFMQTDPNWTNFLFNRSTHKLELLDFGASRDYPDKFIDPYIGILQAAAQNDRATVEALSVQLGYLTGDESSTMANAHIDSVLTLSEPFGESSPEVYDFRDQTITDRVRNLIPVMLRERLAPPPEETYSLHRKLSGAFLLCARLGSRVPCRQLFRDAVAKLEQQK